MSVSLVPARQTTPAPADAQMILAACNGDQAALRSIYEAHATAITRRLTHLSGDADLARDLTQDTFVVAFERLKRFRGDSNLATWLHAIAFNVLRDRRKRLRRERSMWSRLRGDAAPAAPEVERTLQSRQDLARLAAILAQLDEAKRDAFVLRVVEQLSLEETSAMLGVRVATVSYRARRAEVLIRAAFDEKTDP